MKAVEIRRFVLVSFLAFCLSLVFFSCNSGEVEIGEKDFNTDLWMWSDSLTFDNSELPESAKSDLILTLETTEDFPFRNLYVKLLTVQGDSSRASLHNFVLCDEQGYWYVEPSFFQGTYTFEMPLAKNLELKGVQDLKLGLVQYMREDTLKGVRSIGLKWAESMPAVPVQSTKTQKK